MDKVLQKSVFWREREEWRERRFQRWFKLMMRGSDE
jgi:hypothetical protein